MLDFNSIKLNDISFSDDENLISDEMQDNDIAIIGVSVKLPNAENINDFWYNLRNGIDSVKEISNLRRNDIDSYFKTIGRNLDKISYGEGAFIEDIDKFDYDFFNISPKEASLLDPNQRLFLQTAWNAIEDAGYSGNRIIGSNTGVYLGYGSDSDYKNMINVLEPDSVSLSMPGNVRPIIASRIAYILDLKGPNLVIDTTCSSSLVAIHLACQAIRNGECDMALAGGIQIHILPIREYKVGIESSNARTRTFDDNSDGTGAGEGVIVMLLKSLNRAKEDRDNIYAVIKSSSLNQDGNSIGLTAPNAKAQENVIVDAWNKAGIDPETIAYIEAHGTGTKLGDPIEIEGIESAFKRFTNKKQFCAVGSVKSNIGHLDNTAGIAGLLKSVLSLMYKEIFPTLHFTKPNKKIPFENSPVYVNDKLTKWDFNIDKRRCGVSSFGLSGTNCHVVLEEAPKVQIIEKESNQLFEVITISAKTKKALFSLINNYSKYLKVDKNIDIRNLCFTANTGREHHRFRIALLAKDINQILQLLNKIIEKGFEEISKENFCYTNINSKEEIKKDQTDSSEMNIYKQISPDKLDCFKEYNDSEKEFILREICSCYINGEDLDWNAIYKNQNRSKISMPTYPFEKNKCWLEIPSVEKDNKSDGKNFYYQMEWIPEKIEDSIKIDSNNVVLTFNNIQSKCTLVAEQLRHKNINIIEIFIGKNNIKHSENRYTIDGTYDSYIKLFEELKHKDIRKIIHMASIGAKKSITNIDELNKSQKIGVISLFHISKALMHVNFRQKISIMVLSQYTYKVTGNEDIIIPENATLFGLGKVIGFENSNLEVKLVDLDDYTDANKIILEIWAKKCSCQISYRNGIRYIEQLNEININNSYKTTKGIIDGGVYILTGGTGGIGIEIAKYIASKWNVTFIFINRSEIPMREDWGFILKSNKKSMIKKINNIKEIESKGSKVSCYSADVSDFNKMQCILEQVRSNYGGINGIIHSAGVAGEGFILNKEEEVFNSVMSPKVQGTWILDYLTRDDKLDFYILFSSITAISGAPGQGDYTAANSYLDAYSSYRSKIGKPTITINWTGWKETGMAVSYIQEVDNSIFRAFKTKQAIEAFEKVINKKIIDTDRIIIGDFNYNGIDFGKNINEIGIRVSKKLTKKSMGNTSEYDSTSMNVRKKIKKVRLKGNDSDSYSSAQKTIASIWRDVLGFEELSIDDNFFEIGGNSILITKVHSLILEYYPDKVTMSDLFTYSTIRKISEYINEMEDSNTDNAHTSINDQILEIFDQIENEVITIDEAVDLYNLLEVTDG